MVAYLVGHDTYRLHWQREESHLEAINVLAVTYQQFWGLAMELSPTVGSNVTLWLWIQEMRSLRPGHILSGYHFIDLAAIVNLNPPDTKWYDAVFTRQVRAAFLLPKGLKFLS